MPGPDASYRVTEDVDGQIEMGVAIGRDRRAVENGQRLHHQSAGLLKLSLRGELFGFVIGDS